MPACAVPLSQEQFNDLFDRLGPFEAKPRLAVAVSGGSDSLSLAILAHGWAQARGGTVEAVTVDHGLRPHARHEAETVSHWLAVRGISHTILTWCHEGGQPPNGDIQAAARKARYDLLGDYCRDHGIFHLLTAHHAQDQAETFLLRLGRGSGLYGLSGMAAIREDRTHRILRPLLAVGKERLSRFLAAQGQDWIEDPSNQNPAFQRVRWRMLDRVELGLGDQRLGMTARHLGRVRIMDEKLCADHMARTVMLDPAGFAMIEMPAFTSAPDEIYTRCFAALITMIGGGYYVPRYEGLADLAALCRRDWPHLRRRTLGGCCVVPRRGRLLIYRELAAVADPVPTVIGRWDDRFRVRGGGDDMIVGALGEDQARAISREIPPDRQDAIPACVRPSLAAFRRDDRLLSVPHLGWGGDFGIKIDWMAQKPLTDCGFIVV